MNLSLFCRRSLRSLSIVFALMSLTAGLGYAQLSSGNIVGKVLDSDGAAVPGATVTLTGQGAPRVFISNNDGSYRYLGLAPGRYTISAELSGFSTLTRPVDVSLNANSEVNLQITPSLEEAVTVTAETPLIDVRDTGTGANITDFELQNVPSARDPWVVLQTVPGVLVDRVNVGGNKSGQQSYFVGKGVERHQTAWNLDGVNVTDMQATGTSGFYYDFDSFEEFNITTGSTDPRQTTPGVQINMVTKRGSNEIEGSGRYFWTDKEFQADPTIPEEAIDYLDQVNSIENIADYGLELGGPLWRDHVWLWGAYSTNTIDNLVSGEVFTQATELENWNAKLNAQLFPNNSASVYYMFSDKIVAGRGLSGSRPPETTTNQSGPGFVFKVEDTHNFSQSLYATVLGAKIHNGYTLAPRNGDLEPYWDDELGQWQRNYRYYEQDVPQENYRADGSYFAQTGNIDHEFKFGFGYRDTPVESFTIWPGNGTFGNFYDGYALAALTRQGHPKYGAKFYDGYVGDTILFKNLTVQASLRWDQQSASNFASDVPANPIAPDLLPAASYPGDDRELKWDAISPRVGLTYDLGFQKRTVLRGGYSRYIDQLGSGDVGPNNPFYVDQLLYYYWEDLNGDRTVQRGEIDFESGLYFASGIDPDNPLQSTGRVDYNLDPTTTDEWIIGMEHELVPAFAVGLSYSHRLRDNFTWDRFEKTKNGNDFYTSADFRLATNPATGTLPNGESYSLPYYQLRAGVPRPLYYITQNRPDYTQTYDGVELTATKRMSNNWMLRGNVTWSDWKQQVGADGIVDPTPFLEGDSCTVCDDAAVASSGGADGYINATWSYSLNGVYQLPFQFTVGAAVIGREGYIIPRFHRQRIDGVNRQLLIGEFDDERLEDVFQVDLRLAKDFGLPAGFKVNLSADLFNATNERAILWRNYRANISSANDIEELQSPRVWRFGARLTF